MEHRNFDAINPLEKWLGKSPEKLQRLRRIHGFSDQPNRFIRIPEIPQNDTKDPSKIEEPEARFMTASINEQKHKITNEFLHHSQSAKKDCDWLTSFLDDHHSCQEYLKKSDLSMGQLQAMRSSIQASLKKAEKRLTSDQQLPEAARKNIKEFLNTHLAGMNAGIDRMKTLKSDKHFPFSDVTLAYMEACMDKLQKSFAEFAKKLEQSGITSLDQLKENLTDSLNKIEIRETEYKLEIHV